MARKYIVGATIWNAFDFSSEGRVDVVPNINDKGLMKFDRTFKDNYFFFQSKLVAKPMLKIATLNWNRRTGRAASETSDYCIQPITIFSNLKRVELFQNGKSLGKKEILNNKAIWNVPFVNGKNTLLISNDDSDQITDQLDINFNLQPYYLSSSIFKEIGIRLGAQEYFIEEPVGYVWEPAKPYNKGSWGYTVLGKDEYKRPPVFDVKRTDNDPLYYSFRKDLKEVKFDVANGKYEVELLLVDKVQGNIFDILLNGQVVYYYPQGNDEKVAVKIKSIIEVGNNKGINISFIKKNGDAFISAVKVRKIL